MFISKQRIWMILGAVALSLTLLVAGIGLASAGPNGPQAMSQATGATGQGQAATTAPVQGTSVDVTYSSTIPELTPDQQKELDQAMARAGRTGPAGPTNTSAAGQNPGPQAAAPGGEQAAAPSSSPTDLVTFRNTVIPATGISGGYPKSSYVNEPSTSVIGKAIFQTGNWYASRSLDNGSTWTYLNPFTIFSDTTVKGYCCDQVTIYDTGRNRVFWLLQYSNGLKIAQAVAGTLSNWCYYNITPGTVGEPSTTEMDYNDVAIGTNYIYIATNLFPSGGGSETEILRMPIDSLAHCASWSGAYVKVSDRFTFKPVPGSTDVMYWGTNWGGNNGSDFRLYSWAENSGTYYWYDRTIDSYTFMYRNGGQNCASQDGVVTNWCQFADSRVLGAYRANGVIGFSFNASNDGTFPFPYTRRVYFNESDKTYLGATNLWGTWGALLFLQLAPNARGNIGGTFAYGGGTGSTHYYPGSGYVVDDDISPNQPWAVGYSASGAGNTCRYNDNGNLLWRWGDYLTVRPDDPAGDVWAGTAYSIQGANCGTTGWKAVPRNVVFGRFRDAGSYNYWKSK